jgi:hypothetical protein
VVRILATRLQRVTKGVLWCSLSDCTRSLPQGTACSKDPDAVKGRCSFSSDVLYLGNRHVLFLNDKHFLKCLQDMLWIQWLWNRVYYEYFGFPTSVSFHQSSVLIFQRLYHLRCISLQWVASLKRTPLPHINIILQGCSSPVFLLVQFRITSWLMSCLFVCCGATTQIGPRPSVFEVSRSQTDRHTHTHGRTPVLEWSARRRGRYLHNTQQSQETNTHALSGILTCDHTKQLVGDLRLRTHGHRVGYWLASC